VDDLTTEILLVTHHAKQFVSDKSVHNHWRSGRNCFGDLTTQKVSNPSRSRQPEIASPAIPNSIFFLKEGRVPRLLTKLARTTLVKGLR